jgi:signal transduction histidine kinase
LTLQEGAITVTVSDNGMGISTEGLTTIFGLFVQDTRALTHAQGGLGIGLAVVRDLVAAHGGTIIARSAGRDRGSEFIVTLPQVDPAAMATLPD